MSVLPEKFGFVRVAVIVPELRVADPEFNSVAISRALIEANRNGCHFALFPELAITGYTCADLFYQALLLERTQQELINLAAATENLSVAAMIGLPLRWNGKIFNCAAFVSGGKVRGIVPKTYLPTTNEYYEERWFTSSEKAAFAELAIGHESVPFGTDLLFEDLEYPECTVGIEVCEDLWAIHPPSSEMAIAGARLLFNPSASNEILGKADYRRDLVRQQSARCLAGYCYTSAGPNESTTDVVFSGHALIAENGQILAETDRFRFDTQIAIADIDIQRLEHERIKNSSFSASMPTRAFRRISFQRGKPDSDLPQKLFRPLSKTPFVPTDPAQRSRNCKEIFSLQSAGLAKRLKHVNTGKVTIGLSGGLDSTLALLVTVKAFDILGIDRKGIVAITMPGFGTSSRTHDNAVNLANLFGVTFKEISIRLAVHQHFTDIEQDENNLDIAYENSQARERTQILMDIANQIGGLVVGTGDLSELALGWCTYNGDHMSMYGVNSGVPKTLIRYLVEWCAESEFGGEVSRVLFDICSTPISPELLPLGEGEKIQQQTEAAIGPYLLHDFFLFYVVRCHFPPTKVYYLACLAFEADFPPLEIRRWLQVFYRRFFGQQFKRSAIPDGPKVGSVALSPRGDWRMPSDASNELWLSEIL